MSNPPSPNAPGELDAVLQHNQSWRLDTDSLPLAAAASRSLCVITCHDPRLTRLLPLALGLERGDAVLLRTPGAQILPDSHDVLRAIAAAVYLNGCREVLVVGHTDCAIHRVTVSQVLNSMAEKGRGRDTIPGDVRHFFGLRTDLRDTILEAANAIRRAPFLPEDLRVHAGVIDTFTGKFQLVARDIPASTSSLEGPTTSV